MMKLLIADDNTKVREMIKIVLSGFALDLLECDNGYDAYQFFNEHRPDCILMDIEMQPFDGLKATRLIKHSDSRAKVIIVTQHDTEDYRIQAFNAGADGFVSKQNLPGLRTIIEKLIND